MSSIETISVPDSSPLSPPLKTFPTVDGPIRRGGGERRTHDTRSRYDWHVGVTVAEEERGEVEPTESEPTTRG